MSRGSDSKKLAFDEKVPLVSNPVTLFSRAPSLLKITTDMVIEQHGEVEISKLTTKNPGLWDALQPTLTTRLLQHVVYGEEKEAQAMIAANPTLLLTVGQVETYAADLAGRHVRVEGTAFQLALGAEDEAMALMIAKYLDEYYPREKQKQYKAQFPHEAKEEKAEDFSQTADGLALKEILDAISHASDFACIQVIHFEEKIDESVAGAPELLAALNAFRDYLTQRFTVNVITTGKHFNIQLLIEALKLYDQNYYLFGGGDSFKNTL